MKNYSNVKSFEELVELEHGKTGTESRNQYEKDAKIFIASETTNQNKSK